MTEGEFKLEESFLAEVIYGVSDASRFVKWPLFLLTLVCWYCAAIIWCAKADSADTWEWGYVEYLPQFLYFMGALLFVLKIALAVCFLVVIGSLILFVYLFFKHCADERLKKAVKVLLLNSFFFVVSLVFVLLAASSYRKTACAIEPGAATEVEVMDQNDE